MRIARVASVRGTRWRVGLVLATAFAVAGCGGNTDGTARKQPPAGTAPSASSAWSTDLEAALAEARRSGRPLLVVSILGDLTKRC